MRGLLGTVGVGVLALACNNREVRYRQVPVEGLPRCEQGGAGLNLLQRPLKLEVVHRNGRLEQTFTGADPHPAVSLAERADELTVRVGRCPPVNPANPQVRCESPEWLGEAQRVSVDASHEGAVLRISVPGAHPCLR